MGFQRARSAEQRAERSRAILDTAASMLAEMPVSDLSLNELSRRVGLAKSNVLRYFESREAVLLELLAAAWREWLDALRTDPPDADGSVAQRGERLADVLATSLAARPVLCDLLGAQAAVLERNVSPVLAARYKRAMLADVEALGALVRGAVPELGDDAFRFAAAAVLVAGAVWSHARPSAAMLEAYAADPALAAMRLDFAASLRELLAVLVAGLLART